MNKDRDRLSQIEKEFRAEIRDMAKQGRLYEFDKAMKNAVEKYKEQVKKIAEEELENCSKEEGKKKLPNLRKTDESE